MLVLRCNAEEREHRHHHDDVVRAQRLFDEVAGQILRERHVAVVDHAVHRIDVHAEAEQLQVVGEMDEEAEAEA